MGGQPVLGDVDGPAPFPELVQHLPDPLGIGRPAHFRLQHARRVEPAYELVAGPKRVEGHHLAPVVREPDEIAGRIDRALQAAGRQRPLVHHRLGGRRRPSVAPLPRGRLEQELVVRKPDLGLGAALLDLLVGLLVRAAHVGEHAVSAGKVALATGRELARHVSLLGVDVWLVDRAPEADQVAELVGHLANERQERLHRARLGPASLPGEPDRAREVVQREHRLHALLAQLTQHVAVVAHLAAVELARGRLHAGPLDRKSVGVLVQLAQQPEVLAVEPVVVAGKAGAVAAVDAAWLLLELPPVRVGVLALDLVGGGRGTPQEACGKAALGRHGRIVGAGIPPPAHGGRVGWGAVSPLEAPPGASPPSAGVGTRAPSPGPPRSRGSGSPPGRPASGTSRARCGPGPRAGSRPPAAGRRG